MKIALLFPEYGSQFVGMAKELYDQSRIMQEYFEEASTCLNTNFVKLCFASSEFEINQITNAYPAIFLVSTAIAALLKEKGIVPLVVAGAGIGEFSAASVAGSLTLPDGLYFLSKYAQFYQEFLETNKVRAIKITKLPVATVQKICIHHTGVSIGFVETEQDVIVTGPAQEIEAVEAEVIKQGGICFEQPKEAGLHSSLMDSVIQQLRIYLEKIDFRDTEIGLISGTKGQLLTQGKLIQEQIMLQLQSTIRWDLVMNYIAAHADLVIEIGPGIALNQLFKKIYPASEVMSINKPSDIESLLVRLAGSEQNSQTGNNDGQF